MTLGHSDDVDHLVLGEHLADGHLLLKVLAGKVDLGTKVVLEASIFFHQQALCTTLLVRLNSQGIFMAIKW